MYSLRQFGHMITDRVRMEAFDAAIKAAVRPGDVVLDVGAGTGIFSLLACQQGARHVYAIDTNPLVLDGAEAAACNGFADRITFIHGDALRVELPEPVDVLLGDIRGRLPGFDLALGLFRDLATRHLRLGGRTIPQKDTVFVAPVSDARIYTDEVGRPWIDNPFGLDLSDSLPTIVNSMVPYSLPVDTVLLSPQAWVTLDYAAGVRHEHSTWLPFPAVEPTTVHFLALWFDTVLYDGIGYTNAPGAAERPVVYNHLLLPLETPVVLAAGDVLEVAVRADPAAGDFIFTYTVRVMQEGSDRPLLQRRQSTFDSLRIDNLQRRAVTFMPRADDDARLLGTAIALMDGNRAVQGIAEQLQEAFPDLLPTAPQALEYVADLSVRHGGADTTISATTTDC